MSDLCLVCLASVLGLYHTSNVLGACYSLVNPTPVKNPQLVSASADALNLLGLDIKEVLNY